MVWVLNLVDNLRKAADSIDAGRLDERLPDVGDNEIGALARSVNRLIERLQRRSEAQAHFVADASHELATPVAGIRGYTSILREWGADDPTVRDEAVDAIDRESQRMARLTGDLLNLLHADQGVVLKSEPFDLNVIVRSRLARRRQPMDRQGSRVRRSRRRVAAHGRRSRPRRGRHLDPARQRREVHAGRGKRVRTHRAHATTP